MCGSEAFSLSGVEFARITVIFRSEHVEICKMNNTNTVFGAERLVICPHGSAEPQNDNAHDDHLSPCQELGSEPRGSKSFSIDFKFFNFNFLER